MTHTVVFDFDGTLADTLPICYHAFQQVFHTFDDRQLTIAEIHRMFGPSEEGIIRQYLVNQSQVDHAIQHYHRCYEEKHGDHVQELDSIHELLVDAKDAGLQIAIFTGKGRQSLDISMRQLNLNGLFDLLITGDDVVHPKPDPEGLQIIMGRLNVCSEAVVMIGDSDADIEAGKRANAQTIRVDWFPRKAYQDFCIEPDHVFGEVQELRSFLGLY